MKDHRKLPWYKTIVFKNTCIFIITLLPSIFMFFLLYHSFWQEASQTLADTTLSRDEQVFEGFYSRISELEFRAYDLYNESSLYMLSDLWDEYSSLQRSQKINGIQEKVGWYRFTEGFSSDLKVFLLRQNVCIGLTYWREMNGKEWEKVDAFLDDPQTLKIGKNGVDIFAASVKDGISREKIRFVTCITVDNYNFRQLLRDISSDDMASGMILINDQVYCDNLEDPALREALMDRYKDGRDTPQNHVFELPLGKERYFCSEVGSLDKNISILTCRSYDELFSKTRGQFRFIPILIGLNILVIIVFLAYIRRYIKKPIMVLNDAFWKVEQEDCDISLNYMAQDEFLSLYAGFNEMNQRLTKNIQENYLTKIELQRAQLKQMQAQINPHFLYNTLFLIKIRAKNGDNEGVAQLAGLLSDYFRFLNRNSRDVISLEEELAHTRTYMQIQETRFAGRFVFEMEACPQALAGIPIPRLLLQPLVENAVKYGMENIEENGRIRIYYHCYGQRVEVIIEELGVSLTSEEVQYLNAQLSDDGTEAEVTSTRNINRRLKLYYGSEYGLRYEAIEGGGVRTIVELDGGKITDEPMESIGS